MPAEPDISVITALIGDSARAAMLMKLMEGVTLPAGELAYCARISPQTASSHLARLAAAGLLTVTDVGRFRYYSLSSLEVADVLEGPCSIAPLARLRSLREAKKVEALRKARTCYDHLAGELGVRLARILVDNGLFIIAPDRCEITTQGEVWLEAWGIDVKALRKSRRIFVRACVDWSERQLHVGGAVGAAIAQKLFERGWIAQIPDSRGVMLTEAGRVAFDRTFGIIGEMTALNA